MSFPFARNIASVATIKNALRASQQAAAGSYSLTGDSIDRQAGGYESALFAILLGATSGTPDSFTVDAKLQESADNSSWADVVADGINTSVAFAQMSAANSQKFLAVDLSRLKRYVRLVFTVAFVNGTSPKVFMASVAMVGGGPSLPPTHA